MIIKTLNADCNNFSARKIEFYLDLSFVDGSEGRRHPKIVTQPQKAQPLQPNISTKKSDEFDYNEYEYPTANGRPVIEDSGEHQQEQQTYSIHQKSIPTGKKPGYSAGSGLRSIAQGSADQASSAVVNQHAAAKQAAYVAQNTLAQAASQVKYYRTCT